MKEKNKKEDKVFIENVSRNYIQAGRHQLPWRKKISPYRVLVSEIMLQQTQVSRVLPKFDQWMKQFPTLNSLSVASLKDVLILWQGLGYQRRAKYLLHIAKEVRQVPKKFSDLLALSGVGVYTASAVSAFAYNQFSHPVLETNIRTALIEYFHKREDNVHDDILYDDLTRLEGYSEVKALGARKWYYALMDFGASLKRSHISHNKKSVHYTVQTPYHGSMRQLRAKILFAITHDDIIPQDERITLVLQQLTKDGYLTQKKGKYFLKEII